MFGTKIQLLHAHAVHAELMLKVALDSKMQKEVAAQEALKKSLGTLDAYLQSHTYLVGDNVTLADIVTFCNLFYGFTKVRGQRRTRGLLT